MTYMGLYIVGFVAFTQLLRYSQLRGASMMYVIAVNYLVAAACAAVMLLRRGEVVMETDLLIIAAINGVLFFVHLLVMLAAYNHAGVGVTQAVSTSGCVVPVLMAWLLWPESEAMTAARWLGVAIMPAAIFLMRPNTGEKLRFNLKAELVLLLPFVFSGVIGSLHKLVTVRHGEAGAATYEAVLFTFATISSWGYVLCHRQKGHWPDARLGAIIGAVNVFALFTMIMGLAAIKASTFFPVSTSAGIAITLVVSWILWKEKISKRQALGIVAALAVVALTTS